MYNAGPTNTKSFNSDFITSLQHANASLQGWRCHMPGVIAWLMLSNQLPARAQQLSTSLLQALSKEKEDVERCIRRNEEEHSSTDAWEEQMDALVKALRDIMTGLEIQAATPGPWLGPGMTQQQLQYINEHFHKVQPCLILCSVSQRCCFNCFAETCVVGVVAHTLNVRAFGLDFYILWAQVW